MDGALPSLVTAAVVSLAGGRSLGWHLVSWANLVHWFPLTAPSVVRLPCANLVSQRGLKELPQACGGLKTEVQPPYVHVVAVVIRPEPWNRSVGWVWHSYCLWAFLTIRVYAHWCAETDSISEIYIIFNFLQENQTFLSDCVNLLRKYPFMFEVKGAFGKIQKVSFELNLECLSYYWVKCSVRISVLVDCTCFMRGHLFPDWLGGSVLPVNHRRVFATLGRNVVRGREQRGRGLSCGLRNCKVLLFLALFSSVPLPTLESFRQHL